MGHRPKWYWEEVMRRRGMETDMEFSGYEFFWLDRLQGSAQSQLLGCGVHGGRYWELNIDIPKLYKAMAKGNRNAFLRRLSVHLGQPEAFLKVPEDLPVNLRDTACFPSNCNERVLVNEIFEERFALPLMGPNAARKLRNATFEDVVQIQELADWSSIKIDFAIGGVDRISTTAGWRLESNPFCARTGQNEVDCDPTAENDHRPLFPTRPQRKRQLKMIMIFCDPVGRMEKHFMEFHYCFDHIGLDEAKRRGLVGLRPPNRTCFQSAMSILSEREGELSEFWIDRSVADHMPTMIALFSRRIAFAHQEQLRENSEQVLTSLAQFLGVEHSFQTRHFPRYNSVGGNRTDLCYNQSLVRELQRHLEPEYLMQEEILKKSGQSMPEALHKRITRCDRSEAARHCPLQRVCADDVTADGRWTT
eukprot:Skav226491  [mRNA]  locus=scaffold744:195919:197357:- [translate_table: standard]